MFKLTFNTQNYRHFSVKSSIQIRIKKCYRKYIEKIEVSLTKVISHFWRVMKNNWSKKRVPIIKVDLF